MKRPVVLTVFLLIFIMLSITAVFADMPASEHYKLRDYNFGAGGVASSSSETYNMSGIAGQIAGDKASSSTFNIGPGLIYGINAHVPPAPTLTNPDRYYNKLHLVLNTGNNPSDTRYAIAISSDNFGSDIKYVQNDNTTDTTLGQEDWQDYTAWGGAGGINIIGLNPGTTYTVKVSAFQGDYSQSAFGPTAQTATSNITLSFDIDVASTDTETSPPYSVDMGTLNPGNVIAASNKVWVDLDTNAVGGGFVYIYDQYAGLKSTSVNYTIDSSNTNLATAQKGFGIQSNSATQTSGGPLAAPSEYTQSGDTVGAVDTTVREVFNSTDTPITAGRGSLTLKAKASSTTPASNDYADTLTLIAAGTF